MIECLLQVFHGNRQVFINNVLALNTMFLPELPPTFVARWNIVYFPLKEDGEVWPDKDVDLGTLMIKNLAQLSILGSKYSQER
jgi:hypothetical protein